ncbi:unnamed protein product [Rhizophagus irregularis]|uniref:Uncharacterized protein n=1 Tax=Rhizophagus irregularis TaxID=588596 RepID=A0A915ZMU1_9GLOM|nr:unnamed protein product [Rhizophagus irregularis]
MFRNRYTSFNPHHTYIRHRHNKINKVSLQISNERNVSEDTPMENELDTEFEEHRLNEYDEFNNDDEFNDDNELDEPDEYGEFDEDGELDTEDELDEYEFDNEYELDESNINEDDYNDLDENEEGHDELDRNEEIIVDKSLKSEKLPYASGVFAPYFSNITEALMFCWIQKHNICQEVTNNQELWHGNIWKESLRFRQTSIMIANDKYNSGDFVTYRESRESSKCIGRILAIIQQNNELKIKIHRVLLFSDLPRNLQSNDRKKRSEEGEVWFIDREMNDAVINIEPQAIVRRVPITILYDDNSIISRNLIKIREILYNYNGHWKLRDVKYSYRHPSEFAAFEEPASNLPVYKFLKHQHFKQAELTRLRLRMNISRNDLARNLWVRCWTIVAKAAAIAFKESFTEDDYVELRECLDNERKHLSEV